MTSIGSQVSRLRVPIAIGVIGLFLTAGLLVAQDNDGTPDETPRSPNPAGGNAAASGDDGAAGIETARVVSQGLEKTTPIPGDLTPYQAVDIYGKVQGFVESLSVDRGSWVTQGQGLGVLRAPELNAQRVEAEAKTIAAQSTFDRLKAAAATPGVVAGHDVEMAEQALGAARAHVEALKELESYLELRAPFDGVVTERNVHPGSLVGPSGSAILRIEQVSKLRLPVPVPEAYVGNITRGMNVSFTVLAFPGRTFEGVIARPAHSIDTKTRSMMVELDVDNPDLALTPGMFAEVQWPVSRAQTSLFVPTSAVVRTTERQFVIRVQDGVAEWVDVRRGEMNGNLIEVFGELREGDLVAQRGNDEIRQGTRVVQTAATP